MAINTIQIRDDLKETYSDVYTTEALEALEVLAPFNTIINGSNGLAYTKKR